MFKNSTELEEWIAQKENHAHPNWRKALDELTLIQAWKSRLHNHPLKEAFDRGMRQRVELPSSFKAMFGQDMINEAEKRASERTYEVMIKKLKKEMELGRLPKDVTDYIDLEKEIYLCDQDKEIMASIQTCIDECNRLIYYEL